MKPLYLFNNKLIWYPAPEPRAIDLACASHSYIWAHSYERARRTADEALALARAHRAAAAEAIALMTQGFFAVVHGGDMSAYERLTSEGARLAEQSGVEEAIGLVRFLQAEMAEWTADYRGALAGCEQAIAIGRRLRLPHLVIWPTWFRGKAACCLGEYGRAITELRAALELCERIGDRAWKTRILNTLGWCFAEFGSRQRAQAYNAEAAAIAHEIGDPEIIANAEINLAANLIELGDTDRASAYLAPILAGEGRFSEPFQRWRYTMHATHALAEVAFVRREPERAAALVVEEREAARRHRSPKIEARALELHARALLNLGRRDEAEAALAEALRIARAIGYPRAAWRSLKLLGEVRRRAGRREDAERCAAEARAVVETLARSLPETDLARELHASASERWPAARVPC